ncbi:MAG: hypothetical protein L3V56_13095, partial [Candidatus Magnetoovum sp. WYHC-5]|nr:hypothetical protein [Candidatus Magnetoovum sp. WYHC-5]
MTLSEILQKTRWRLDDNVQPYLWPDEELTAYVNDSVWQLCRECLIIEDALSEVCTIPVVANTYMYDIDSRIVHVKRVKLLEGATILSPNSEGALDLLAAGWQGHSGTPTDYILDMPGKRLSLYPIPDTNYTLNLTVYRVPLTLLSTERGNEEPELDHTLHRVLIDGILCRAYEKSAYDVTHRQNAIRHKVLWNQTIEALKKLKQGVGRLLLTNSYEMKTVGRVRRRTSLCAYAPG